MFEQIVKTMIAGAVETAVAEVEARFTKLLADHHITLAAALGSAGAPSSPEAVKDAPKEKPAGKGKPAGKPKPATKVDLTKFRKRVAVMLDWVGDLAGGEDFVMEQLQGFGVEKEPDVADSDYMAFYEALLGFCQQHYDLDTEEEQAAALDD